MDTSAVEDTLQTAVDASVSLVSNWGLQVVGAIAVLFIGRFVASLLRNGVQRTLTHAKVDAALVPFFASMVYYAALAVVVIAVLNLFGIETTSLVAVLGAAGLAIGLALQGTLSNFSSGVMLLIFRPFHPGDFVEIAGKTGFVKEIGVFSTTIDTPDNIQVTIPNASVYGQVIENYTGNEKRRIDLVMGISYTDDIPTAIRVMQEVVENNPAVLSDPAPQIAVCELGDSSVNLVVRPWCLSTDYWPVRFELTQQLKEGLEAGGCSIPFPQRDLHLITLPDSQAS